MKNKLILILVMVALVLSGSMASAENYVNFKGGFYFEIPEGWDNVDYMVVDYFLSYSDTSAEVFNYEVVYAPTLSETYLEQAYVVVTFDSIGNLSKAESDSILKAIARNYSHEVFDGPIVQFMSDLIPGKPQVNLEQKAVSVMVEMAQQPGAKKQLWQYMQLNDIGLVSLYFYAPDSLFEANKPIFDAIVNSLSFENLRQAASGESAVFTEIGRETESDDDATGGEDSTFGSWSMPQILVIVVAVIVIFGLIWNFAIRRRG